ncbi:sugar kinase [Streptomyces sp. NPDC002896]|uniref:sugar kinase n=1 Tax=Streptomyces sp. NPDC002896 TaxID=3154438 RepID=UPI0033212ED0
MTPVVPRQSPPPDESRVPGRRPEDRPHVVRRRFLTALIIVLLIGIPAGYLVISANQSRDSGKDKEAKYSATGLTAGWPSKVQRRLYDVPIPAYSEDVAYYETNNWKTSRLYVQFVTSNKGLDKFLDKIGTSGDTLVNEDIAISPRDRRIVGWDFSLPGSWSGLTHEQKGPQPTLDVVVDRSDPEHPMVYVVSRATP